MKLVGTGGLVNEYEPEAKIILNEVLHSLKLEEVSKIVLNTFRKQFNFEITELEKLGIISKKIWDEVLNFSIGHTNYKDKGIIKVYNPINKIGYFIKKFFLGK